METVVLFLSGIPIWISFKFLVAIFVAVQLSLVEYFGVIQEAEHDAQLRENINSNIQIFDYIIVGGGMAGCILANRLSVNPTTTVLLLERSGDPNPFTRIPGLTSRNIIIGSQTLAYFGNTTVQPHACLEMNGTCSVVSGKSLGGSSNINTALYTRGSPQIFDKWAEITQNKKWKYKNVLKFFKKSEDYHGYYKTNDSPYHATGGEWYIGNTDRQDTSPALQYFSTAAEKAGYPFIDINNGDQARSGGYGHFDFYIKNGERWGTYSAFLQPILGRKNLLIYRYSRAIKILFQFHGKRQATGVSYIRHGVVRQAYARREVILSAGTFGSAELLLRSGIGPKEHLDSLNIPLYANLPVGETLIDHYVFTVVFSINKTLFFYPERDASISNVYKYFTSKTGKLGKTFSDIAYISVKSSVANKSTDSYPDLELIYSSLFANPLPSTEDGKDYFAVASSLVNPKSIGNFKLSSKDISDNFLINPNYLGHPYDLDAIVEGIQTIVELIETSPQFKALGITIQDPLPACQQFEFKTKEYWKCSAAAVGKTLYHYVGTCRMGASRKDSKAVVDSELKVLDVAGLRVVDASVMPKIPNAHTSAATVMIAEMGANFILSNSN